MPLVVRILASLKLTVVLLMVIAAMLSFGTILESLRGAEAARAVYYANWFFGLQALLGINIVAALWERWPRNRWRIGFVITHASMLLILAGALMTAAFSVEGRLPLWEGQSSDHFLRARRGMAETPQALPFQVRLDAYEMDFYPGTERPAMFRSRVTVIEASGATRPAVIEMNQPLYYGGYAFFQSSYQIRDGREMSILSVAKDPGQAVVFWGYYLMVLGMLVVLVTRIVQHRAVETAPAAARVAAGTPLAERGARVVAPAAAVMAGLLTLVLSATPALAQHTHHRQVPPAQVVDALRSLPVQYDGREMPLDTQAREAVLVVTGRRQWPDVDPVAMVLGWTMDPQGWMDEPIVKIDDHLAGLVGLPPGTPHASFRQLISSIRVRAEYGPAIARQEADRPQEPGDKSLLKLDERVNVMDAFMRGDGIRAIPARERAELWSVPANPADPASYTGIEAQVRPGAPAHYPSPARIRAELLYNRLDPVRIAWWLLLPAAIAAGMTLERNRWRLRWVALLGMVLGFAAITWAIGVRWQIAERIPASNMYESMMFLAWGVALFGVVSLLAKNRMLVFNAAAMAALVTLLLDRLPIDPFIHPMAPVLSGTPWLAIHVPIIMVSYSTLVIATFLAHLVLGAGIFAPARKDLAQRWSQLLYWYLLVGSILLIAGILTGSIWAASSWGRYWGWDPKEVWSLVAFLAYMAILHARSDGQIFPFGVAVASIVAFWTILMTYLGVNFVLASGLHSYGFGSNSLVRIMLVIAGAETVFLLAAWRANQRLKIGTGRAA